MLTDNSNSSKKAQSQMNESEIIEAVQQNPTILNRPELQSIIVHQQKIHTGPFPAAEDIVVLLSYTYEQNKSFPQSALPQRGGIILTQ